jgi:uncharacterized protein (DUF3820 family)
MNANGARHSMTIESNVAAANAAKEACSFVLDCLDESGVDPHKFFEYVLGALHTLTGYKPPQVVNGVEAFTNEEAAEFGRRPIPFGEYRDVQVKDVPIERLCWYADQRFTDGLRRYLANKNIQAEIPE